VPSVEFDEDALRAAALETKDLSDAIKDAAEDIADAVRGGSTGSLVESISVEEIEDGGWRISSDNFVMVFYEFGTGMRMTKDGAFRGEMPAAHPFLHAAEGSGLRYDPGAGGGE
jgi:hypothetical protein